MKLMTQRTTGLPMLVALAAGILLVVAQGLSAAAAYGQMITNNGAPQSYVSDELLVKFRPGVSAQFQQQSISSLGAQTIRALNQSSGWMHLKLLPGLSVDQALAAYQNDPNVESVQPNFIYHIAAAPNDPSYSQQWALKNTGQTVTNAYTQPPSSPLSYTTSNPGTSGDDLGTESAWGYITDCSAVTVAVVDSGVNYNHGDLAANMWNGGVTYPNHGYNYVDTNNDPMDRNGHGTHVAGIIGAVGNNSTGTAGVCWKASIMAVRVMNAMGSGTTSAIVQGVNFAVTNGAKAINLSLGGSNFDQAFSDAITNAQTNGVVVVVAAGNDGLNNDSGTTPVYPCNYTHSNIICVAALDQKYLRASFSNYGATSVDVGAPGTNILSTWAGTNAVSTDALTSGWIFSTTTSGGWTYGTVSGTQYLLDPAVGQYNDGTDDRAYKTFSLAGDVALLRTSATVNVANSDYFRIGYKNAGGDPFGGGTISGVTGVATTYAINGDISSCISASCSIGFQLQTDVSGTDIGVGITGFSIQTLTLNTTSLNTINGTSMATPAVAGVATMVRAYNPSYTYTDVITAIKSGGVAAAALSGKTTTGKAVDAMRALAYINPPTGVTASVQ